MGEPISFDELRSMESNEKELNDHLNEKKMEVLTGAVDVSSSVELKEEEEKQQQQKRDICEPDWDDPDCVLLPLRIPPRESVAMAPVLEKKKNSEENVDTETELLPYDPPLPRNAKLPQYLHHVISRKLQRKKLVES